MIPKRYAQALFDLDPMKERVIQWKESFLIVKEFMHNHPELQKFIQAPHIKKNEKKKVLEELFQNHFDPTFTTFLFLLFQNGRFSLLSLIAEEFQFLVDSYFGVNEIEIVTAIAIDPSTEERLQKQLETKFQKKVQLKKRVDPSILGGLLMIMGNVMFDGSIEGRIRKLQESLYDI